MTFGFPGEKNWVVYKESPGWPSAILSGLGIATTGWETLEKAAEQARIL